MLFDHVADEPRLLRGGYARQSYEQDTSGRAPLPEDEFAEVFVARDEEGLTRGRGGQDRVVVDPAGLLRDVPDIVPSVSKVSDDRRVDVLVGDKPQAAESPVGYRTSLRRTFAAYVSAA